MDALQRRLDILSGKMSDVKHDETTKFMITSIVDYISALDFDWYDESGRITDRIMRDLLAITSEYKVEFSQEERQPMQMNMSLSDWVQTVEEKCYKPEPEYNRCDNYAPWDWCENPHHTRNNCDCVPF